MKQVILTGSNGFVGHHVLEHLLRKTDWHIFCIDMLSYASFGLDRLKDLGAYHNPRVTFLSFDLSHPMPEGMRILLKDVDYVLHVAAESHVDNSIKTPVEFVQNNVNSTLHLLDFVRNDCRNLKKFMFFSTDEVFGYAPFGQAYKEGDRHNCGNPYSASKSACESICRAYCNTYRIPIVITNSMNIIGERQHVEKYVPKIIRSILTKDKLYIHTYPDKKTSGSRGYIHARNVADAFIFVLENSSEILDSEDPSAGCYNISSSMEITNLEMYNIIAEIMKDSTTIELVNFHEDRPGHDLRYALDGSKLSSLGWTPPVNLIDSLHNVVKWSIKNKSWLNL